MGRKNYLLLLITVLLFLLTAVSCGAEEKQEAISLEELHHNLEIPELAKVKF